VIVTWDVAAPKAARREGTRVELVGMNAASTTLVDRLAQHDKPGAMDEVAAH